MPVFLYTKRTTATLPLRVVQSIHHKNYVKKVITDAQNNFILNLLIIEDQNIKVLNFKFISNVNFG